MTRVSELTGALLDYYVARAEGIPAEQLTIRRVPRSEALHCVREWVRNDPIIGRDIVALPFSTSWSHGGPLIEKHSIGLELTGGGWAAHINYTFAYGDTPLQAICRAVVRAAFGDEVDDVPVQQ